MEQLERIIPLNIYAYYDENIPDEFYTPGKELIIGDIIEVKGNLFTITNLEATRYLTKYAIKPKTSPILADQIVTVLRDIGWGKTSLNAILAGGKTC